MPYPFVVKPGRPVRCDCHQQETLAVLRTTEQVVEVRDRRHGTVHSLSLSLTEIARSLDPAGTTVRVIV